MNEFSAGECVCVCVCVCKLWNNIATTYQPVGICCLGNYKKGCYLGKCAQLLLTSSSNWGRAANHTPSFEMVGRTNDENIIAFILSLDWWLILAPWLLWICDHQCLMVWQTLSVSEMVPVAPKHLHRLWWVSCSARIVRSQEITEQESLPSGNKLTYILHYSAFLYFRLNTILC